MYCIRYAVLYVLHNLYIPVYLFILYNEYHKYLYIHTLLYTHTHIYTYIYIYTHIQLDKALSDYDECIHLDPTFAEAYNKRAEIRQIKGLYYVKLCYIRYIV